MFAISVVKDRVEGKVIEEGKMNQFTVYLALSTSMFIFAHKCRKVFYGKKGI